MAVGVDTGGTYTDAVDAKGSVAKVLSKPNEPETAVRDAISSLGTVRPDLLAYGTTVATNALLERRGAKVALLTTDGFADVIEIGRQSRPSLYDVFADRPEPLVPRDLRFEVWGRLDARGAEIEAVADPPDVPGDLEGVAVCLLHADLNAVHERAVATRLRSRGLTVTCSSEVSPEFREYERTVTTVLHAYLRPVCAHHLRVLGDLADAVLVLTSAGGLVTVEEALERPATLLASGPAGGARAGAAAAQAAGFPDAVTLDMGGTSTDVCLITRGAPAAAAERRVAGFPLRAMSLDVHTVGAGGGSIAWVDSGGALRVGPRSAGADPGAACYGRGGAEPTVTDADLVAGRLPPALVGVGRLDSRAARSALDRVGIAAAGVIEVVDETMARALRAVTIERGVDPRELALVAFGGAGPVHAAALADRLGMRAVVVPSRAGVLSAVGVLGSPRQADLVRSWPAPADRTGVDDALAALARDAAKRLGPQAAVEVAVDCRYTGQSHELTVPSVEDFHLEHERRNGYRRDLWPVEVVALRATAQLPAALEIDALSAATTRKAVHGPSVIEEPDCTVFVPEGWRADVDDTGSYVLTRG